MGKITYQVIRSARRTIAIQITKEGRVLVCCPYQMKDAQIDAFVNSKHSWIEKHLHRQRPVASVLTPEELEQLRRNGQELFRQRVTYFAPLAGVQWNRITVRFQKTRWGSCTGNGNLSFNGLLLLAPPEVLDYVVVHELCHRKEMNHSPKFWAEVARVCPQYAACRKWLREHGATLIARLGQ